MNPPVIRWNTNAIMRGLAANILAFFASAFVIICIVAFILAERNQTTPAQIQAQAQVVADALLNHPIWAVTGLLCGVWGGMVTARHAPGQELSHSLAAGGTLCAVLGLFMLLSVTGPTLTQGFEVIFTPLAFGLGGWWQKQTRKNAPPAENKPDSPPPSPPA